MSTHDDDFLQLLLATFKIEATEHLDAMAGYLQALELDAPGTRHAELLESLFREAHSMKGAARAVDLDDLETLCHAFEGALAAHKGQALELTPAMLETLAAGLAQLAALTRDSVDAKPAWAPARLAELVAALDRLRDGAPAPARSAPAPAIRAPAPGAPPLQASSDTVRISTGKLASLLTQVEEQLALKYHAAQLAGELGALREALTALKNAAGKTARDARALRRSGAARDGALLTRVLDGAEQNQDLAKTCCERLAHIEGAAQQDRRALCGMVDALHENVKETLMLPFGSLSMGLSQLVRTQSRANGKHIELHLEGAAMEVDRRILEQLKAPLIHLISNAIDHGIESPARRVAAHKTAQARIVVALAARAGNMIELTVSDDGAGIDLAQLGATAVKCGLLEARQLPAIGRDALLALLFESGFSCAPMLTGSSGRGLGLAIAREKVERLGGSIKIARSDHLGSQFCIALPATLTALRGLLVAVGEQRFVLPLRNVERVLRLPQTALVSVENRASIILGDRVMALLPLAAILGLQPAALAPDWLTVLVLVAGEKRLACQVDAIDSEQEVLLKQLGPLLRRVRNIAGAAILGPGRVLPVLNVEDLLVSAQAVAPAPARRAASARAAVLVVDDSMTSRTLLKNVLETAGYEVSTAVDGKEALQTLRGAKFDLLVSDVDMPRMNGFDLTAQVRADHALSELPVILVTSTGSREHKERGIEVGASAYIVKSDFKQSNLLDLVRSLL
ncbi:two-component system chemotaxis sensor kinase CheA [Oxalobacteraceae bacterium GrIS 1.11]